MKNVILILVLTFFSYGLGFFSAHRIDLIKKKLIKDDNINKEMTEKVVTTNSTNTPYGREEDPFTSLKMLQKDMEAFQALIKEINKELLVVNASKNQEPSRKKPKTQKL